MKLITAIVNKEDSKNVCNELLKSKFYVTAVAAWMSWLLRKASIMFLSSLRCAMRRFMILHIL